METPNKLTRPELQAKMDTFFHVNCHQGPQKVWRHNCGTALELHHVSLSIHNTPPDQECGGSGRVEIHILPYCPACEPELKESGCLHDLGAQSTPAFFIGGAGAPILVWRFDEAPEEYQKLSPHGGDEDWLALIPPAYEKAGAPDWIIENSAFAICHLSMHRLSGGFMVAIGTHS